MGYSTNYELEWSGETFTSEPCPHCHGSGKIVIEDVVEKFVDEVPFLYGNTEPIRRSLEDSCKWYEHEDDLKRLSEKFPNVLFTLNGTGEEAGDVWVKYFKGGKMQVSKVEIKLDQFDPKKLA